MSVNKKTVNKTSENIKNKRTEELKKILPEVFTEGKIDFEKLKLTLGEEIDKKTERFNFTWSGKNNAIKTVLSPSKATLKPSKDESIKFDDSENLIIEGDNLEVLKLLQKTYFESIKMIYIDPPYNTGGDFVYHDDYATPINSYLEQTGQLKDGVQQSNGSNKETNGRYHSDWLSMMYPRLKLAWNLLKDDGVIFISIDDNEVQNLKKIVDEIFGEENVDTMIWHKSGFGRYGKMKNTTTFRKDHEYVLVGYKQNQQLNKTKAKPNFQNEYDNPDNDPRGSFKAGSISKKEEASNPKHENYYTVASPTGKQFTRQFDVPQSEFIRLNDEKRIYWGKNGDAVPAIKIFVNEEREITTSSLIQEGTTNDGTNELNLILNIAFAEEIRPKPTRLIKRLIQIGTDTNSIVLDFFAGSGTTAQAVLELNEKDSGNRKFILVQLPEPTSPDSEAYKAGYKNIAEITKERVRRVIKGYGDKPKAINSGFKVFKLAPSNYPEISYEFDPEKTEEENKKSLLSYLAKAKQTSLIDDSIIPIDIVYENIVKEGFSLNSSISEGKVDGNHIFIVKDGEDEMRISLDKKISSETVKKLSSVEFKGKTFVCYDNALSDSDKANIGLNLELKTI